jgi:hypothetical protein
MKKHTYIHTGKTTYMHCYSATVNDFFVDRKIYNWALMKSIWFGLCPYFVDGYLLKRLNDAFARVDTSSECVHQIPNFGRPSIKLMIGLLIGAQGVRFPSG